MKDVTVALSCELAWVIRLLRGQPLTGPVVARFHSLLLSGVVFNMMIGRTGELNLPAIGRAIADGVHAPRHAAPVQALRPIRDPL